MASTLLIAIAVIASTTTWYWVVSYTTKPALSDTTLKGYHVMGAYKNSSNNGCSAIDIKNTGGTTVNDLVLYIKDYSSGKVAGKNGTNPAYAAYVNITGLSSGTTQRFLIKGLGLVCKTFDGGTLDSAEDVDTDSNGNVIVTGMSNNTANNYDYYTIKYDRDGNELWSRRYDGGSLDQAYEVVVDSQDNVIVTGTSQTSNYNYYTIKYDSSGNQLWTATYSTVQTNHAKGLAADSSNNVFVSGSAYNGATFDAYTIKYNGSSGTHIWNRSYDGGSTDYGWAIAIDLNNSIIVAGQTYSGSNNWLVIKYNSSGDHQWNKTIDFGGDDLAYGAITDSQNNIIVAGVANSNFYTIKLNSSGSNIWNKTIDSGGEDGAYAVGVDTSNNIYVAGYLNYNASLIKYDSNGNQLWNRTYDGGGNDAWFGLAVDLNNYIFVTGESYTGPSDDYFTQKYDNNGNILWTGTTTVPFGTYILRTSGTGSADQLFTCA